MRAVLRLPPRWAGKEEQEPRCRAGKAGFAEPASSRLPTKLLLVLPLPLTWLLVSSHPPRATAPFFCTRSLGFRQALLLPWICYMRVERKPHTQKTRRRWDLRGTGLAVSCVPSQPGSVPAAVPPRRRLPHSSCRPPGLWGGGHARAGFGCVCGGVLLPSPALGDSWAQTSWPVPCAQVQLFCRCFSPRNPLTLPVLTVGQSKTSRACQQMRGSCCGYKGG